MKRIILYYWSKLLKKIRGSAVVDSQIHRTSKVQAGSQIVKSIMDKYSYCGYDCKLINCVVGAYTSIADDVVIGGAQHPMTWVSMSPVFYRGRSSVTKKFAQHIREIEPTTYIGNDVWIGERSLVKAGVIIGDGAVVGMGSVVTKNIEPYSIVAGNPAKTIRMRFGDEQIIKLKESKWWKKNDSEIKELAHLICSPEDFLKEIYK